jgi:glycosyltransferase involved in cell wall biosynthesis
MAAMRIALDARVRDGEPGGVQQTVLGLASGLAALTDADDEYLFLVDGDYDWLRPALRGPCRPLVAAGAPARGPLTWAARQGELAGKVTGYLLEARGRVLPPSDGTVERAGAQLVHFLRQRGFSTPLPSVYQPHDLQHLVHPRFFHPLTRAYRRVVYRAMARRASRVAVMTTAGRDEVLRHLPVAPSDVVVVPWASLLSHYPAIEHPPRGVPDRYLLYPAQSWPHKNHLGLVTALSHLRAQGLEVPVVLTGRRTAHWQAVESAAADAGVGDLLHPRGFVAPVELRALYAGAVGVVVPSLYEGWGLPVVEAFEAGVPVACSGISPLREIAAGAALHFDPADHTAIAVALRRLWCDAGLRRRLAGAGRLRANAFSWERTARLFRAHYRAVLGHPTQEDRVLLAAPPVV